MRIGALFTGYGGLELGVSSVLGAETAWVSEIDKAASKVLARRFPGVPNIGDITAVDWASVAPVDVLTGGFPCQDVSHAGKRAGLRPGTRSGLWSHMAYAIEQLRPRLVVAENVRGLLSATAYSDVEPCPVCLGGGAEGAMRALGAVLGDLADLGYDAAWCGIRAADVGDPHGRFRVFVVAADADPAGPQGTEPAGRRHVPSRGAAADASGERHGGREGGPGVGRGDGGDAGQAWQRQRARPVVEHRGAEAWGQYAAAIHRWEILLGRLAPAPTQPWPKGSPRLSALAVEWMMGLPEGWVTDVPGVSRNYQLKMLGNGVVPQQAAAAVRLALGVLGGAA